ncbi:hypothetical protein CCACVL1_22621 [Corchorus capsularis]|uniref:Uncharacterized protein n=1 Tax=Corchorus capsularis TaxID=210143 RepID=A0A1R3GXJ1_COCAP|nr:hypothetical protein CCACVL1_22621 [Corchorus capsularis]
MDYDVLSEQNSGYRVEKKLK